MDCVIDYIKEIADRCCDPFDDVAIDYVRYNDICGGIYTLSLSTPDFDPDHGYFPFKHGCKRIWSTDFMKKTNTNTKTFTEEIEEMVKKVHDEKNFMNKRNTTIEYDACFNNDNYRREVMGMFDTPRLIPRFVPEIKKVIFNEPATIVFWTDGTKTVVKCSDRETFDKEKGLAMAISKKCLGTTESQGDYYKEFKKWL